jgi:hypothetical protein
MVAGGAVLMMLMVSVMSTRSPVAQLQLRS